MALGHKGTRGFILLIKSCNSCNEPTQVVIKEASGRFEDLPESRLPNDDTDAQRGSERAPRISYGKLLD